MIAMVVFSSTIHIPDHDDDHLNREQYDQYDDHPNSDQFDQDDQDDDHLNSDQFE